MNPYFDALPPSLSDARVTNASAKEIIQVQLQLGHLLSTGGFFKRDSIVEHQQENTTLKFTLENKQDASLLIADSGFAGDVGVRDYQGDP